MKFNICKIQPKKYIHANTFDDFSNLILFGMRDAGFNCSMNINKISKDRINIIIGTHLLSKEEITSLNNQMGSDLIIYTNTEQLGYTNTNWLYSVIAASQNNKVLWDYSLSNIRYLKSIKQDTKALFLKIGYNSKLEKISNTTFKDIDILFYGSNNKRRILLFERLKRNNIRFVNVFGVYGQELDKLISRSKFVLNLHFYESKILESIRLFYLITNKIPIISEISEETIDDQGLKNLVEHSDYDNLLEKSLQLLNKNYSIIEAKTLTYYNIFTSRIQSEIMSDLINKTLAIYNIK